MKKKGFYALTVAALVASYFVFPSKTAKERLTSPDGEMTVVVGKDSTTMVAGKGWQIAGAISEWQWDSIRSYAVPVMKTDTLILNGIKYGREQVGNDWDSMRVVIDSLEKAGL